MSKLLSGLLACAAGFLAVSHSSDAAAQSTWNLQSACNPAPVQGSYVVGGNTVSCTTGVPAETATITAWSNIGSGGAFLRASMGDFTGGIGAYSGTGETSTDSQHAFDNRTTGCNGTNTNCGGSQEMMLVGFGPYKVSLTSMSVGYRSGDADVAILRWDGADKTDAQMQTIIAGLNTTTLTGSGWTLVGTESLDTQPDTTTVNLGNKVSSWWIVSTYYGTAAASTAGALSTGNDRFKVSALAGSVCTSGVYTGGNNGNGGTCGGSGGGGSVPEPGSLVLAGLALFGAVATRRRVSRRT